MRSNRAAVRWVAAVTVVALAFGVQMSAAFAAHHHHHHHHHPPPVTDPSAPSGPVTVVPSTVVLTTSGAFVASLYGIGLPPGIHTTIDFSALSNACAASTPPPDGDDEGPLLGAPVKSDLPIVVPSNPVADGSGRFSASITCPGPTLPGTYPIIVTEDDSPFQSFVAFITLTFGSVG